MSNRYKILIDEEAISDITEAAEWYEEALSGLGKRFKEHTKKQINTLKKVPFSGAIRNESTRGLIVKRFPFVIYYIVNDLSKTVEIHAVLHTSRNPTIWKNRR